MAKKVTKSQAKKAVKTARKHPKIVAAVAIILVVIIIAVALFWYFKPEFFHKLLGTGDHSWGEWEVVTEETCTKRGEQKRACTVCGEEESKAIPAAGHVDNDDDGICEVCHKEVTNTGSFEEIPEAELSIHFLKFENNKAGDSTLIKCGNTEVLIDAGSTQASSTTIKNYIDRYCTDGKLEYVIATHADEDHIAGLVGRSQKTGYDGILYSYEIGTIIRFDKTRKQIETDKGNETLYGKFEKAVDYAVSQGAKEYTGLQCYNQSDGASRVYYLDDDNKISMNILYNYYYDHDDYSKNGNITTNENDYSVCMLLKQEIASGEFKNYLFTGDLEENGEKRLVEYNDLPEVELFKAGHHGSPTSSNDCLLSVIKPKHVAVCCCAGTDEYSDTPANQFPSQAMIDRVAPYTDKVFVTNMISESEVGYEPMNGNIVFYVKDDKLKYFCSDSLKTLREWDWFRENRTCPAAWKDSAA